MAKYNVSGVVHANIFWNGIEAETQEEAIKKLKDMLETCEFVDWTDWHDIEVSEVLDYSKKVNDVLESLGLSDCYKAAGIPEIVYDYKDFDLFAVRLENLVDTKEKPISGNVYFIVKDGDVYLPFNQGFAYNKVISFNYMNGAEPFEKNLKKVFFSNGNKTISFSDNGDFKVLTDGGAKTMLGRRIQYIIAASGVCELYVTRESDEHIELATLDGKFSLVADYEKDYDDVPSQLTKIEHII